MRVRDGAVVARFGRGGRSGAVDALGGGAKADDDLDGVAAARHGRRRDGGSDGSGGEGEGGEEGRSRRSVCRCRCCVVVALFFSCGGRGRSTSGRSCCAGVGGAAPAAAGEWRPGSLFFSVSFFLKDGNVELAASLSFSSEIANTHEDIEVLLLTAREIDALKTREGRNGV